MHHKSSQKSVKKQHLCTNGNVVTIGGAMKYNVGTLSERTEGLDRHSRGRGCWGPPLARGLGKCCKFPQQCLGCPGGPPENFNLVNIGT